MPLTEQTPSSGGAALEAAIPADDNENSPDGGQADIGRLDVDLRMEEQTISSQ